MRTGTSQPRTIYPGAVGIRLAGHEGACGKRSDAATQEQENSGLQGILRYRVWKPSSGRSGVLYWDARFSIR